MPVAMNCCVFPCRIEGFAGVTAIDTSVDAVTVRAAEPMTEPDLAEIVAVPMPAVAASPRLPASLLIAATPASEELQITDASLCVLLSAKTPVATNCWPFPRETDAFPGVTEIDTRPGGVAV